MAVPTSITDLSDTIASNSPAGSDIIGGTLDNYLRAHAGIIHQESQNKSWLPTGQAVTYVSINSFSVVSSAGGQSTWYMGRPIKLYITGSELVGVITASVVSGSNTVVTFVAQADIDATLYRVDLGFETTSLAVPQNFLVNPFFRFWQRNTTFTTSASGTANVADGWAIDGGTSGVVTCSRQAHTLGQVDTPYEQPYFLRYNQSTGGTGPKLKQHIEGVRTLAGRTITLCIIAKVSAATLSVGTAVTQYFGTGGSPSTNVTQSGNSFTLDTTFQLYTTSITVPSISGKTIGTTINTDSTRIDLTFPDSSTFTVDIAAAWVTLGKLPTFVPPAPFAEELLKVQRRYYKTFPVDTVPAQNFGDANSASIYQAFRANASIHQYMHPLPVNMRSEVRAAQTITFFNPNAANALFRNITGGSDSGAGTQLANSIARNFVVLTNAQALGDAVGDMMAVHFTLDSEYASTV